MSIDSIRLENAERSVGLENPSLAVGLSGIADWSDTIVFMDLMKMSRGWFDDVDGVYHWFDDLKAMGHFENALDENGWPTYIPEHIEEFTTIWDWTKNGDFAEDIATQRAGTYVLRYEGEGQIDVYGGAHINVVSQQDGEIVFENTTGETFLLSISSTDPNETGDYIKDVSIVNQELIDLYDAGAVFHPDYIAAYADMRELRYMDMMGTNHSDEAALTDRPMINDLTYMDGIPVEMIVALANETGTDVWINIPHLATDEYVEFIANYLQENLDPNLKVTVEYSNETWNSLFEQSNAMYALGQDAFDASDAFSYLETSMSYYGMRAAEVMQIFTEAFDGNDAPQLVRVIGGLTGGEWVTEQALEAPVWQQSDPDGYEPPANFFDAIAVTTYFGGDIVTSPALLQTIADAIKDTDLDANQVLADMLRDPDVASSLPNLESALAAHATLAVEHGLNLVSYEGGQHVHHLAGTAGGSLTIDTFLRDFVRSEEMGALYEDLIAIWDTHGDGPLMNFGWVGAPSIYGSWAAKATYDDTNPRAEVLDNYNETNVVDWEAREGTHFQQGVTLFGDASDEVLTGTIQEDYLLGGDGNDLLVGGRGNDGLNGGAGEDEVLFNGAREDYSVMQEGNGYRIQGLDGSDFIINVEWLTFESGEQFELASMALDNTPITPTSQYKILDDEQIEETLIDDSDEIEQINEDSLEILDTETLQITDILQDITPDTTLSTELMLTKVQSEGPVETKPEIDISSDVGLYVDFTGLGTQLDTENTVFTY